MDHTHVTTPAAARRLVRISLTPYVSPEGVDDAELLASELVTNAMMHGHTDAPDVGVDGSVARVEVADGSRARPAPVVGNDPSTPGGFGLNLVETLADRWGVDACDDGKTVWFEIDAAHRSDEPRR
jgi:two-component sensor histidine kinase